MKSAICMIKTSSSNISTCSLDSSDSNDSSSSSGTKSVSFSPEVSMQIHSLVLGDSPSCPVLPLQLAWHYDIEILDLDTYESSIVTRRRRSRGPKKLLYYERCELLQDVGGYSPSELYEKKMEAENRLKQEKAEVAQATASFAEQAMASLRAS